MNMGFTFAGCGGRFNMARDKHFTPEPRQIDGLFEGGKPRIAMQSASTVIVVRTDTLRGDEFARYCIHNRCIKRRDCNIRYLCGNNPICSKSCSGCSLCNELCPDYAEEACNRLYESQHYCSGCPEEFQCMLMKKYNLHKKAHEAYLEAIKELCLEDAMEWRLSWENI